MYASRHLAHEHPRRPPPSVEESSKSSNSISSLRKRFEGSRRPPTVTTPQKKHPRKKHNYVTAELADYINGKSAPPPSPVKSNVGKLIEKFSLDRQPLTERQVQPHDRTDYTDTFSSEVAMDRHIPKTDPAGLKSYAKQAINPGAVGAASVNHPISVDQSVREIVAKSMQPPRDPRHRKKAEQQQNISNAPKSRDLQKQNTSHQSSRNHQSRPPPPPPKPSHMSPPPYSKSESKPSPALPTPTSVLPPDAPSFSPDTQQPVMPRSTSPQHDQPLSVQQINPVPYNAEQHDDWGAGEGYLTKLLAVAQTTAEQAVQCDEEEQYLEAFERYCIVVELYYRVIPFLSPEEGHDVHERISMYTRRCVAIREAFDDDPDEQDEFEHRMQDAAAMTAQKEEQLQENFSNGVWNNQEGNQNVPVHHNIPAPQNTPVHKTAPAMPTIPSMPRTFTTQEKPTPEPQENVPERRTNAKEPFKLERVSYPDVHPDNTIASIPEAPRATPSVGLSAATKAHRSSLSRPISKMAVRDSFSPEKMAHMEERVNLMMRCLQDFTVKKKHLGPASALEMHITHLNANTFGDLKKLEATSPELEHKWKSELEVLLSIIQEIKESRPGEIGVLRQDIAEKLPKLKGCDSSIRETMRSFSVLAGHVKYVERETSDGGSAKGGRGQRRWWVKVPVVAKGGLPPDILHVVQEAEKNMRAAFNVCHEINVEVIKSIPAPDSFLQTLPKHARAVIPRELKEGLTTWSVFNVSDYMRDRNKWNKDAAQDLTSRLEKVSLIWEQKTVNKSFLSRTLDLRGDKVPQAMNACRRCQNAIRDLRRAW